MQLRSLILPLAIVISILIYFPTHNYGLVTDYLGWLNKYRDGSWSDIAHCFNYPGLHQFFHLINYTIYKVTNAETFSLYLIFATMHGVVSYCVYRALRKVGEWLSYDQAGIAAFFAAIMFLFSPYQAEAVTWKACFHYLMITGLTCLGIITLIRYLTGDGIKYIILHMVVVVFSLLTIELGLVTPGIYGIIYLAYFYQTKDKHLLKKGITLSIVHFLLLVLYFLITKVMIGSYVGHYGAEQHMDFSPSLLITTASKYFVKYAMFTHYYSFQPRYDLYAALSKFYYALFALLPLLSILLLSFLKGNKSKDWLIIGVGFICFLIALLPVLNLYFMNLHHYENDRYGYFASMFFYYGLTAIFLQFGGRIKYGLCLIFTVICIFLSLGTISKISTAGNNITTLVDTFKWYDNENIVIAGLPENHDGIYMFRDFSDAGVTLKESLDWQGRKTYNGNVTVLSKYNMKNDQKHLDVKFIGKDTLQVWDIMPGSWFWRKGVGMGSYENDRVKVNMKDGHFNAVLKNLPPNTIFIYPSGNKWEVIEQ